MRSSRSWGRHVCSAPLRPARRGLRRPRAALRGCCEAPRYALNRWASRHGNTASWVSPTRPSRFFGSRPPSDLVNYPHFLTARFDRTGYDSQGSRMPYRRAARLQTELRGSRHVARAVCVCPWRRD